MDRDEASAYCLRLLSWRPRSRAELFRRLRERGCPDAVSEAVIDDLGKRGWVNDYAFALIFSRDQLAARPQGRRRLQAGLQSRGVDPVTARRAITHAMLEWQEMNPPVPEWGGTGPGGPGGSGAAETGPATGPATGRTTDHATDQATSRATGQAGQNNSPELIGLFSAVAPDEEDAAVLDGWDTGSIELQLAAAALSRRLGSANTGRAFTPLGASGGPEREERSRERRRLSAFLERRGFTPSVIRRVFRQYEQYLLRRSPGREA